MNKLLFLFLIFFSSINSFGQSLSYEEVALKFYAENILSKNGDDNIFYDGKIIPIDSNYQQMAEELINYFYGCKYDPRGENNESISLNKEEFEDALNMVKNYNFKPFTTNNEVKVPEPIIMKKKLKWKKYIGGIRIYRLWRSERPIKFNLSIQPVVHFKNYYFVCILIDKNDFEYGNWFFIKLTKEQNVVDWCSVSWIQ
ncbi:hypothetical protein KMW28_24040 [Flammeovirga yaeyamensis]|uniref:Uncharacterized protein n=1 Tax=Flammeovirga yaeyamensis TaxID=367791 RepID=A0AAX1NDA0_9BACT|nr:hypothetical protein [Flammeovirga yaeyamensis]MBB3696549.1 hypothetical protein [Flammeovirga yaeyamensis]NMF33227.1 hypothetical protein [Flammeovirga yaeyamensis]QWG05494.1 hypothetical protein KMW28_24040 [Flammeovirga yaeyamensis]